MAHDLKNKRRLESGLCYYCGDVISNKSIRLCEKHVIENRIKQKNNKNVKLQEHRCVYCGIDYSMCGSNSSWYCPNCQDKRVLLKYLERNFNGDY
jgi:predicted RNA-binding Zn-ribbon protein involved in translation (DUF1610 family)